MDDGERGSYLLMSLVLGILVVPIIVYGQREESDVHAVNVVNGINVTLKVLAAAAIMFVIVSIHKNKTEWVSKKSSSLIIKTKLGFLWVFGFAKIVFNLIHETFYLKCRNLFPRKLTTILAIECFINIPFVILQLIFFLYVGRYTFTNKPRIKYVVSVIVMTNFMEFLILMTLSVNGNKDLILDGNSTAIVNCIGYSHNVLNKMVTVHKAFKTPIALQFTALAITHAFSMKPDTETLFSTLTSPFIQCSWRTPRRLAEIVIVVALMNIPPLVYFPFKFVNPGSKTQSRIWIYTLLAEKTTVLICILAINYLIFKKLKLCVKYVKLNVDEVALLVSTVALVAYITIETFDRSEEDGLLTALHVINLISILYQIIIILFGRRMDLVGNEISTIHLLQQFVLILACNNMAEWFNCFLYGLWNMERVLRRNVFKYIAFMLYPLLAYCRLQSAIELMELYGHVS
ncbi:uncharacterized protein LOC125680353 [Ostrea edulis]|uniref:uncharacterized protein LOC125680353 n=1 Tax=Ostrea edulis TaxID=37623 RepID=UPI0020964780|nr:uncharacterized protein LOC125680353 [Ostrea edulis]